MYVFRKWWDDRINCTVLPTKTSYEGGLYAESLPLVLCVFRRTKEVVCFKLMVSLAALGILFSSCLETTPYHLATPDHFPKPQIPEENQLTSEKVELGRKLFFDKNISLDSTISCMNCHLPGKAFTDSQSISIGIKGRIGKRNSSSILNAAYLDLINRDGGVKTLDLQALVPIEDENEMGISIIELTKRLRKDSEYVNLSRKAYQRDPDAYVVTRALASFVRTLFSGDSPYDRYYNGDSTALSATQKKGMNLFFSDRLNCSSCHSGIFLTNNEYENNGLYKEYKDLGRALITLDSMDVGKFRVPNLRNVAVTGPYMHDGGLQSLEDVIDHYASFSRDRRPLASDKIKEFNLTDSEKEALVHFLESLTGEEFQ